MENSAVQNFCIIANWIQSAIHMKHQVQVCSYYRTFMHTFLLKQIQCHTEFVLARKSEQEKKYVGHVTASE